MGKNGYLQLENKEDGTYLKIFAAKDGGKELTLDEVISYFNKKQVIYSDLVGLRNIFNLAQNGEAVKVSSVQTPEFSGWCEFITQPDGMKLSMIVYPPIKGKPDILIDEIMNDLKHMNVKYGVSQENINNFIKNKEYFTLIDIAVGTPPIDGYDAELTYMFSTKLSLKPKMNEDGTVDFHKIENINRVKEGDVVAEIKPEDPGIPGTSIYGNIIKAKKVYRKSFKHGKNLMVSEDGTQLISMVTGKVSLDGDKVFVSNEYEVPSDVDVTTGDIEFDGNVHVKGNVLAGFRIKANGNVVVDGVVEGATIEAEGNIILKRGIQGMNKGSLRAGGDVVATFIENSTVRAFGNIDTDAILHSKVAACGSIEVHGKNGYLIGGMVRAGSVLTAKYVGSEMGTTTVLGVGTDPELLSKINGLKLQIKKSAKDKEKLQQFVTMLRKKKEIEGTLDKEKTEFLQKSMKNVILLEQSIREMMEECKKDSIMIHEDDNARVKITGTIYAGCKLEFGEISLYIRDKNDFCQYVKKNGEIIKVNL